VALMNNTKSTFRVCGKSGQLAAVTSAAENDFIVALGINATGGFLLLGGFQDPSVEESTVEDFARGWSWIDEGSFSAGNFTGDNNYSNWEMLEPDNRRGCGDEDCLTVSIPDRKWHDRKCDFYRYPFPFVLEVNLTRENQSLDGCLAGLDIDPLVSVVASNETGSYMCTYLSEAIASAASVKSVTSLLTSLSGSLTQEQIATILDCVKAN
jgi:Lectin C-type domain